MKERERAAVISCPHVFQHRGHDGIDIKPARGPWSGDAAAQFTFASRIGIAAFTEQAGQFALRLLKVREFAGTHRKTRRAWVEPAQGDTFLGRMCLSGEVHDLSPAQWNLVVSAMELYRRVAPIIRDGHSTFHGETGESWRHPQGWQAVLRTSKRCDRALLVAHSFAKPFTKQVEIPLPGAGWKVDEIWPAKSGLTGEFRTVVVGLGRS